MVDPRDHVGRLPPKYGDAAAMTTQGEPAGRRRDHDALPHGSVDYYVAAIAGPLPFVLLVSPGLLHSSGSRRGACLGVPKRVCRTGA